MLAASRRAWRAGHGAIRSKIRYLPPAIASTVEEGGFTGIRVMEHFFQIQDSGQNHFFQSQGLSPVEEPMLA